MTTNAKSEQPSKPDCEHRWSVLRVRDDRTGKLSLEFCFPNGNGGQITTLVPNEFTTLQMLRHLRAYTTALPAENKEAGEMIIEAIERAPSDFLIGVSKVGWQAPPSDPISKPLAFVTPNWTAPKGSTYRLLAKKSLLGTSKGSLKQWQQNVLPIAGLSNYMTFVLCAYAAGPCSQFLSLPELATFHFFKDSSVGKTTVLRVGESMVGPPGGIADWDTTLRALEEEAACRNNLAMSLNAAEKASPAMRKHLIEQIVHSMSEGSSKRRSSIVQDQLPDVTWNALFLSTGNEKGSMMTSRPWQPQDSVRFIDIPVPAIESGGVFDVGPMTSTRSSALVKEIEAAIKENYGTFLPAWIDALMQPKAIKKISGLSERYLGFQTFSPGVEERIARKFALVYAAGRWAQETGLLPFEKTGMIKNAVLTLHNRATSERHFVHIQVTQLVADIKVAVEARDGVFLLNGKRIAVSESRDFVGVLGTRKGRSFLGLRLEGLQARYGSVLTEGFLGWLSSNRVFGPENVRPKSEQLRAAVEVNGHMLSKPRFLLVDADLFLASANRIEAGQLT